MTEGYSSSNNSDPTIYQLEQSLIQYLSSKHDIDDKVPGGQRRVRGLTFKITRNVKEPSFSVQIGIMEAVFDAINGMKIRGSCYSLERYIRDWFLRATVNQEIKNYLFLNKK